MKPSGSMLKARMLSLILALIISVIASAARAENGSGAPIAHRTSSSADVPVVPVNFLVCSSTYALCTGAPCTPLANATGFDACTCQVKTGKSAGLTPCQKGQPNGENQTSIVSRYYPIHTETMCSNDRPWAMCLDSPCIVNDDQQTATCICTEMKDQGTYVFYDHDGIYNSTSCATPPPNGPPNGVYSLATQADVDSVTGYLQLHQTGLQPKPLKICAPETKASPSTSRFSCR